MKSTVVLLLNVIASVATGADGFVPGMPTATSAPRVKKNQQITSTQALGQERCDADSLMAGEVGKESRRAFVEKTG